MQGMAEAGWRRGEAGMEAQAVHRRALADRPWQLRRMLSRRLGGPAPPLRSFHCHIFMAMLDTVAILFTMAVISP